MSTLASLTRISPFPAHGSIGVEREDRILVVRICGPTNLELFLHWHEQVDPIVDQLESSGHYAVLIVISGSMLTTPEAAREFCGIEYEESLKRNNCVAQAIVANTLVEGCASMMPYLERQLALRGLPRNCSRIVQCEHQGREFLAKALLIASQTNLPISAAAVPRQCLACSSIADASQAHVGMIAKPESSVGPIPCPIGIR
jgi:hypothetical protein